jgi:hypothetical protein
VLGVEGAGPNVNRDSEQNLRPKISVKNYMSRKILIAVAESPARTQELGRSGSEGQASR